MKYIPNSPVSISSSFFKFSACNSANTKLGLGKKGRHYGVVECAVASETTGFKLIPFSSYVTFYKQVRVYCHICKMGTLIPWGGCESISCNANKGGTRVFKFRSFLHSPKYAQRSLLRWTSRFCDFMIKRQSLRAREARVPTTCRVE